MVASKIFTGLQLCKTIGQPKPRTPVLRGSELLLYILSCIKQVKYMVFEKLKIISQHGNATLISRSLKLRKERDRMWSVIHLFI